MFVGMLFTFLLALLAGASQARSGFAQARSGASQARSAATQPPREYRLSEVYISLSRGACESKCPVYTVIVHGGGMVAYQGEENVAIAGQQIAMISPQAVEELLEAAYAAGFADLQDKYLSSYSPTVTKDGVVIVSVRGATGSPRSILVLTIGDYSKRIVFQPEHAPADLVKLADLVDELADSARWTRGR